MNSGKSKSSNSHVLMLNLTSKIDLGRCGKSVVLSKLSM